MEIDLKEDGWQVPMEVRTDLAHCFYPCPSDNVDGGAFSSARFYYSRANDYLYPIGTFLEPVQAEIPERLIGSLEEWCQSAKPGSRTHNSYLTALGCWGCATSVPLLIEGYGIATIPYRYQVINGLGRIGGPAATHMLERIMLHAPEVHDRIEAARDLSYLGFQTRKMLPDSEKATAVIVHVRMVMEGVATNTSSQILRSVISSHRGYMIGTRYR